MSFETITQIIQSQNMQFITLFYASQNHKTIMWTYSVNFNLQVKVMHLVTAPPQIKRR